MTRKRIGSFPLLVATLLLASCRTTGDPSEGIQPPSDEAVTVDREEDPKQLEPPAEPPPVLPHAVRDESSRFEVRMPTPARLEKDTFETEHGSFRTLSYMSKKENAVFVATFNELPSDALAVANKRRQLLGARDGSLASTGGELLEEFMLTVSGHPGLEMAVRVSGGFYRARIVIANEGMYQVLVAADTEEIFSDLATAFLESLIIENGAEP